MATSYPGGLDTFTALPSGNLSTATAEGRRHGARHNDVEDAVEAIEAELGTHPSGSADTVAARLTALDVTVAGKEADGAAAAAVAAHAADGDPHSQYATDSDLAAHVASATAHIPAGAVALGQVGAVRWDETVGRRAFMWDTVNSRWQMVYGDTGWRVVGEWDAAGAFTPGLLVSAFSGVWSQIGAGKWMMRRIGNTVYHRLWGVQASGTAAGIAIFGTALYMPSGWKAAQYETQPVSTTSPAAVCSAGFAASLSYLAGYAYNIATPGAGASISRASMTFVTDGAWPASLPGVASGSIPAT